MTVKLYKTYKYKLKPTISQANKMESWLHTCRFVYNCALEERITVYTETGEGVSKYEQYNQLPSIKTDLPFVAEVYSDTLQEVLDRVDNSYKKFFSGAGYPKFKGRNYYNSFSFKRNISIVDGKIKLPKIGLVKYFKSRDIVGKIKTADIKFENGSWFICLCLEKDVPETKTYSEKQAVGLDLGINTLVYLSDGTFIASKTFNEESEMRLLQRKLARQKRGYNSRKKTVIKIKKLHLKITNRRKDYLHKQTTILVNKYPTIFIEDLNVSNMIRSKSSWLNKSLMNSSFGLFRELLSYKMEERRKTLLAVPPYYTSQKCSGCDNTDNKSRISQSEYVCTNCGLVIHADLNASKNILREGVSQVAKAHPLG